MFKTALVPACAVCLAAGMARVSTAQTTSSPTVYRLEADSTFQQGCFPPCECPLQEPVNTRGTLVLTPTGFDGLYYYYTVTDVNWTLSQGNPELRVTGAGTYRFGGDFALLQRLSLDLNVGSGGVQHFDSGWLPRGAFPRIDAEISIHGQVCYDTVIRVNALPVPAGQIRPYRLQPTSNYQHGCCCGCACPEGPILPILGTFALVPLQLNPLFQEFAVVNVNWRVLLSASTVIPVQGFGTYRVGGEVAVQHQLSIDPIAGNDPQIHVDSGLVGGGGNFPRIDIRVSIPGAVCVDTVINVHAKPGLALPIPASPTP